MRKFWLSFISLMVPLAAILGIGGLLYGNLEISRSLRSLGDREAVNISLSTGALSNRMAPIKRDLLFLSMASSLQRMVRDPSEENLAQLTQDFSIFVQSKQIYDQVRWIDETGREVLHIALVQGQAVSVPAGQLQHRGQRDHFVRVMAMNSGQVFMSPLELKVGDDGQVVRPHEPVIHLATPLLDQGGRKRGVVALDYHGKEILEAFTRASDRDARSRLMLTDAKGYWLVSPDPADGWGFMFNREDLTLASRFPAAWQLISAQDSGQVAREDGLWTWDTVFPLLQEPRTGGGGAVAEPPVWKAVSRYSSDRQTSIGQKVWGQVALGVGLLLAVLGLGSWKLARAWGLLAESESKFHTIADFTYDWEIWIGPTGNFLFSSSSCERITGRRAEDFEDNPDLFLEIVHPEDRAAVAEHLQQHLADADPREISFRILLPDGQVRWIAHACLPVFGDKGEFLGRRASNRDITERKMAEAQVEQLAFFDPLTGLPNRRLLSDRLLHALSQAKRFKRSMAIMFIDLDYFKTINDTLGHDVGDELLKIVAQRLEGCVRSGDTVARQGGDEFIVVLAEINHPEDAAQVAEKVAREVRVPMVLAGTELEVTASIGIAVYPIDGTDDARELMKKADKALYRTKEAGRNGYRFAPN